HALPYSRARKRSAQFVTVRIGRRGALRDSGGSTRVGWRRKRDGSSWNRYFYRRRPEFRLLRWRNFGERNYRRPSLNFNGTGSQARIGRLRRQLKRRHSLGRHMIGQVAQQRSPPRAAELIVD